MRLGYFYHVTIEWWGEEIGLSPRVTAMDESILPRICVAPTVPQCFSAIYYETKKNYSGYNIYRTKDMIFAEPAREVYDQEITEEHWIRKDTLFTFCGKIPPEVILMLPPPHCGAFSIRSKMRYNLAKIRSIIADDGKLLIEEPQKDIGLRKAVYENSFNDWVKEYYGAYL